MGRTIKWCQSMFGRAVRSVGNAKEEGELESLRVVLDVFDGEGTKIKDSTGLLGSLVVGTVCWWISIGSELFWLMG